MVVKTTPPPATFRSSFRWARVFGLDGGLADEVLATREGGEELVVEVVAVGQDDEGGVLHLRRSDDLAGEEEHGETLARTLGVPDDADAAVAAGL